MSNRKQDDQLEQNYKIEKWSVRRKRSLLSLMFYQNKYSINLLQNSGPK